MTDKRNVIFDSQILSTLMSCERLTDFRFNLNLVPITGKGRSLEMGSMLHHILAEYYRSHDVKAALAAGEKYIVGDGSKELPGLVNTSMEDAQYVLSTAEQYFEFYKADSWTPLEVEKVFSDVVYEDDDIRVMWKAKLDVRIDTHQQGLKLPMDHKTMSQRRETLDLNNQFMGQCVVAGVNQMIVNKIGWQKTLKPVEKFQRVIMSYSSDRLDEWKQLVGYYANYWIGLSEVGFYPPRFSHCDKFAGCIFRSVCSQSRSMREEELRQHFVVGEPWEPQDE